MFLLSRYYQRRREEIEQNTRWQNENNFVEQEMRKRAVQRELAEQRRHAATCGTLICIFVSGSALVLLGVGLTCTGVFVPRYENKRMPWLVAGPSFIVVGVLVLLLSVEIIIKRRKVGSTSNDSDSDDEGSKYRYKLKPARGWTGKDRSSINIQKVAPAPEEQSNKLHEQLEPNSTLVLSPKLLEKTLEA